MPTSFSKASPGLRRSVMQLLVCEDDTALTIAATFTDNGRWPEVIDLCRRWKTLSALESRLSGLGFTLPPSDRTQLSHLTTQAFVLSTLALRSGSLALTALEAAGIRCAGFKGIAAIAYLYPGARHRTLQDVDILIAPQDLDSAFRVLEQNGYQRSFPGDLKDYLHFIRNAPGTVGNEAMSFTTTTGSSIDLHWRLGTVDVARLLNGAQRATVLDRDLPLLAPGHCLLLCAHHALRSDFVPDDIARDVLDFSHWLTRIDADNSVAPLQPELEASKITPTCLALFAITTHLRGTSTTHNPFAANAHDTRSAHRMTELYLHQLEAGPLNTDLTYLTSPRPWIQVVSGLARGWGRYRSHMRHSEALNGERSTTLAARASLVLRAAMRLSPARWLQLRALAQAKSDITAPPTHYSSAAP